MQWSFGSCHGERHGLVEDLESAQDGRGTSTILDGGGIIGDLERQALRRGTGFDEVASFVWILLVQLDAALLEFGPILDVDHVECTGVSGGRQQSRE